MVYMKTNKVVEFLHAYMRHIGTMFQNHNKMEINCWMHEQNMENVRKLYEE